MCRALRQPAVTGLIVSAWVAFAAAQQGSIQVSGSAHALTGDPQRIGDQTTFDPDAGVSWFQPGIRFGVFQLEVRGTRRGDEVHLGKAVAAFRDVKIGAARWTFEAGDLYFVPVIGDYRFTNLTTPAITFTGGAVAARSARSSFGVVAGNVTAWRNIFGTDSDTLGQQVALARASHAPVPWLELNARASYVRTTDVKEFTATIAASDQGSAGAKYTRGPVQLVADGGLLRYKRVGSTEWVRDHSLMAGASVLLARGWVQVNASRFSPGDFPVLNNSLVDRRTAFAAGEYDVWRHARLFGGWERFHSNLDPEGAAPPGQPPAPENTGDRGFGGVRVYFGRGTGVSFRLEDGDRRSYRIGTTGPVQSDTGVLSVEFQSRLGSITTFLRGSRRQHEADEASGSYQQDDGTVQLFVDATRRLQFFGTVVATRNDLAVGGGSTYYQYGGGAQVQLPNRSIWLRAEGLGARNLDLFTRNLVARTSLDLGLNGQVARNTIVGLNVHAEYLPANGAQANGTGTELRPWTTRSILRVTRNFATGAVRVPGAAGDTAAATRARGTGSIDGLVFEDWDADGVADEGERPLEGIPILLGTTGSTMSSSQGAFAFASVPVGLQRVGLDVSALPVDFDAPAIASVQIELSRGDTRRVSFGLVPLGSVSGRLMHDANGNDRLDAADQPFEGGVLVLDEGARSEQARKGRYRFDAVRSGAHTLDLLPESLPEGTTIVGERRASISVTQAQAHVTVDFLVKIDKRPEIRRVFPPKGGGTTPAPRPPAAPGAKPRAGPTGPPAGKPAPRATAPSQVPSASRAATFTIQVAALSDSARARELAAALKGGGYPAYVLEPLSDTDRVFRVRVGRYASRAAVDRAAAALERERGEKLWVIRER